MRLVRRIVLAALKNNYEATGLMSHYRNDALEMQLVAVHFSVRVIL